MIDRVVNKIRDMQLRFDTVIAQIEKESAGKMRGLVAKREQLAKILDKTSDKFTEMSTKITCDQTIINELQNKIVQIHAQMSNLVA